MSRKELVEKLNELELTSTEAKNKARVENTPENRQFAIDASKAVSDFMVEHNLMPKARGYASRAGQRQYVEMMAITNSRKKGRK